VKLPALVGAVALAGCYAPCGAGLGGLRDACIQPAPQAPVEPLPGPSLDSPDRVVATIIALKEAVQVGETLQWVLAHRSFNCPRYTGDAPMVAEAGETRLLGDCSVGRDAFGGGMQLSWAFEPDRHAVSVRDAGWGFSRAYGKQLRGFGLGGDLDVVRTPAGNTVELDGGLFVAGDRPGDAGFSEAMGVAFPWGFDGHLVFDGREDAVPATFELRAGLQTREGALDAWWAIEWGECSAEPTAGSLTLSTPTELVEVEFGGPCDGCVGWTLNGEAQPEPLCFPQG
jgi:hypothetical protein